MIWTGTHPYELESGQIIGVHAPVEDCFSWICPIHGGTPHPLALAPRWWDPKEQKLKRVCPHGAHHPDLDAHPRALCFCVCDCCAC